MVLELLSGLAEFLLIGTNNRLVKIMRILHVMASCSRASGVAQVIMNYYRQISKDVVFDFLLFWREEDSFEEEIHSLGGMVFYTGKPNLKSIAGYIRKLDSFFKSNQGKYDAVQLHELYINSIIFPLAKRAGIKIRIAHSHTTKYSEKSFNAIRNRLLYLPIKMTATDFFACSKDAGKVAFGNRIVESGKLYIVNNAICIERFFFSFDNRNKKRQEFGLEDVFVVGHTGRFSPAKNHEFLLKIFQEVLKRRPASKLLLVGDGKLKRQIQEYAKIIEIDDHIIFTGQRKDNNELLSAMDCFVLPSVSEGLGIVLIEAQSNGLPCLASSVVPDEAKVLSSFKSIDLSKGESYWAEEILKANERTADANIAMTNAGFNIIVEGPKLEKKYKALTERR